MMKQKLIFILFFLSVAFYAFPQDSLKKSVMLPFEIIRYHIDVDIPESYDRIDVRAKLKLKELYPADTLKITLCYGFKGTLAANINVLYESEFFLNEKEKPLSFIKDSTLLKIILPKNYFMLTQFITISYSLIKDKQYKGDKYENFAREISDSLCHINAGITRTDNWYPHIEGAYPKRLPPFELSFTTSKDFELVASGQLTDEQVKDNKRITKWVNYPEITDRSLFFYAVKGFTKITKSFPDFKIYMYVSSNAKIMDTNINYIANLVYKTYRFFEDSYGNVPGNEFKILFNSFWASTSNYTSGFNFCAAPVSYLSGEIKTDYMGFPHRTLLHEISHTWWGNVVAFPSKTDYWLFESFAKYSEIIAVPKLLNINNETFLFQRVKLACLPYLDYTKSISESGNEQDRQLQIVSSYYQGATLLNFLKYVMGEDDFNKGLKDYVTRNKNKTVTTADFIKTMQENTKQDITGLLNDYLYNPDYAKYSISNILYRDTDSFVLHNYKRAYTLHTYKISNTGNKVIFSELYAKSDIDSLTQHIKIEKGESTIVQIKSSVKNQNILIQVDKDRSFPIRETNIIGGGGCAFPQNDGKVVIWDVVENTPFAKAGITSGMELLAINNDSITGESFEEITSLLMKTKGDKCKLQIRNKKNETSEVEMVY